MDLNYIKALNIPLEDILIFKKPNSNLIFKYLKRNHIYTLSDLFRINNLNDIILGKKNPDISLLTFKGIVSLLKYKYLNEPLDLVIDYKVPIYIKHKWQDGFYFEFNSCISFFAMGFSNIEQDYFFELMKTLKKDIYLIELLYIMQDELKKRLIICNFTDKYTINFYNAFIEKLSILISYYEKIYNKELEDNDLSCLK